MLFPGEKKIDYNLITISEDADEHHISEYLIGG